MNDTTFLVYFPRSHLFRCRRQKGVKLSHWCLSKNAHFFSLRHCVIIFRSRLLRSSWSKRKSQSAPNRKWSSAKKKKIERKIRGKYVFFCVVSSKRKSIMVTIIVMKLAGEDLPKRSHSPLVMKLLISPPPSSCSCRSSCNCKTEKGKICIRMWMGSSRMGQVFLFWIHVSEKWKQRVQNKNSNPIARGERER